MRSFALAAVAALGLSSTSCLALAAGVHDTEIDFLVAKSPNNAFFGWTEISIDGDVSQANSATLQAVTLDVQLPEGTADLSFLKSLTGEIVLDEKRVLAVTGDSFPRGEQAVVLKLKFTDDIRPFFKNGNTLRVEWNGTTDPAFTKWPADGFTVRGRIKVDIE
ncbi:MAG: hypothetical protein ABJE95_20995 [Byssovorax sp.]